MLKKNTVLTYSEENYLKIIYHLFISTNKAVSTNAISEKMENKASSVTDMLKKLSEKELIDYTKYKGVSLTQKGLNEAVMLVRKHRLWEVFLVEKLNFSWDEVHEIAEELEHIKSEKLINKLDSFLGFPKEDPHGDPIPNKHGEISESAKKLLSEAELHKKYVCVGVKDTSPEFLQYLDKIKIGLGTKIKINEKETFDHSISVEIKNKTITISNRIANAIYIK